MTATFPFTTPPRLDHEPEALALLEKGPVLPATMGPMDVWLALSHQAVRAVLADSRFSRAAATRPGGPVKTPIAANPLVISGMEGAQHNRVRKLMGQAFSPKMLARLQPRIQSTVDALLVSPEPELVSALCMPLPTWVICEMLGAPHSDTPLIREFTLRLFTSTITVPEIEAGQAELHAYLLELVRFKRANPDEGLISAMVAANDAGDHLTEPELLANLQGLLIAGHDTSINQLANSFVTLLRHPDQLALLRADLSLIGSAVEELLRYTRLFSAVEPRVTTAPVELEGVLIPEDATVLPVVVSANRDPAAYPGPERFDIARTGPAPHLAFGHGPHFCIGAQLARMEMRAAIAAVAERFPDLALAVDPDSIDYNPIHVLRSPTAVPVSW